MGIHLDWRRRSPVPLVPRAGGRDQTGRLRDNLLSVLISKVDAVRNSRKSAVKRVKSALVDTS